MSTPELERERLLESEKSKHKSEVDKSYLEICNLESGIKTYISDIDSERDEMEAMISNYVRQKKL